MCHVDLLNGWIFSTAFVEGGLTIMNWTLVEGFLMSGWWASLGVNWIKRMTFGTFQMSSPTRYEQM